MPKNPPTGRTKTDAEDPLGLSKLKQQSVDEADPLGLSKLKPANNQQDTAPAPAPAPAPVAEIVQPRVADQRFIDIFHADNTLDEDLAFTNAISLNSVNNQPAKKFSLSGFNTQQAATQLNPSFEDQRKAKISSVKRDPDALRDYRKKRSKDINDNISNLQSQMDEEVDPMDITTFDPTTALTETDKNKALSAQIKEQKDYKDNLSKSIGLAAQVAVPNWFIAQGKAPTLEEVGKKYLETVGYAAIGDDKRVLEQLDGAAPTDPEEKANVELTTQAIKNRFFKEGAAAMSAYHVLQAQAAQNLAPESIQKYADLIKRQSLATTPEEKQKLQPEIDSYLSDPNVKSFSENAAQAISYADKSQNSSQNYPQVQREEKRQKLNDLYFAIEQKKMEQRSQSLNPLGHIRNGLAAFLGEDPTEEDVKQLAQQSGLSEKEVQSIVDDGKEGFFAKARKGVRVNAMLSGVSQAADETLANSVMGFRRLFNTDNVDSKNALLQTSSNAYNMSASGNMLYDASGNLNLNPFSIANTAGRGVGQMAVFAAPTLVTGGLAEGLLAPELKAAALAGKEYSTAKGIVKASEILATHASGYIGSYEPAYRDISAYTDDEETRRAYANIVAHANAGAEHLMSPADIAKNIGIGAISKEAAIKAFVSDAKNFGVQETVGRRILQAGLKSGEVLAAENIEEQATNLVTNKADENYMGKVRTASELSNQFWQTLVSTSVNMLPMAIGAGVNGLNDLSSIRKQGLFEAGNEPDAIRAKLKEMLSNNQLNNDQYNNKVSMVNTMKNIVANVDNIAKKDGTPLTYDEKVEIAAHEFRIRHNNNLKTQGGVTAQAPLADADSKEAQAEQQAIIDQTPLYKVNGKVVDAKEAKAAIESQDKKNFIEIKNDPDMLALLHEKGTNVKDAPQDQKEPTIQDVIDAPVLYNGMAGTIVRDGMQYVFQQDNSNREYVIEPQDNYESMPVSKLGIHPIQTAPSAPTDASPLETPTEKKSNAKDIQAKISRGEALTPEEEKFKRLYELSGVKFESAKVSPVVLNEDDTFTIRGEDYINNFSDPFQAISRDKNGNVVSVSLDTKDGGKRTFRGDVANDIAYQLTLKSISGNADTRNAFEQFINTDESTAAEIAAATDNQRPNELAATPAADNNGQVPVAPSATEPAGTTAATEPAAVGQSTTGIATGGQQQSGQSAADQSTQQPTASTDSGSTTQSTEPAAVVDPYSSNEEFKKAFDALSPEDKTKYGDLMAEGDDQAAEDLLKPKTKTAPTEQGVASEPSISQDQASNAISIADEKAVKELSNTLETEPLKKSILRRATVISNVLKTLIPHSEIFIHTTSASMKSAMQSMGQEWRGVGGNFAFGEVDGKPLSRIDIDLSTASLGIVAHEASHAVMQHVFGDNAKLFSSFRNGLAKIIDKSTDERLTKFTQRYTNEDVRPEEYLAELGAVMTTNYDAIKPSLSHKIKTYINTYVTKALGKSIFPETESAEYVRSFFETMNTAFKTGKVNPEELTSKANKVKQKAGIKSKNYISKTGEYDGQDIYNTKSGEEFHKAISEAMSARKQDGVQVEVASTEDYQKIRDEGGSLNLSADGKFGFYVKNDGEIGGLFKNPSSTTKSVISVIKDVATKIGGKFLNAFDVSGLQEKYKAQGLSPVARVPFDEQYAPEGWKETALKTKPDVLYFVLDKSGKLGSDIRTFNTPEEANDYARELAIGKNGIFYKPDTRVGKIVKAYVESKGMEYNPPEKIFKLDEGNSRRIAKEYEDMKHDPSNPEVKRAYEDMANETVDQYNLVSKDYKIELYKGEGEPYSSSRDMIDDLIKNNHLYIFATESGFGDGKITDEQRAENPLLQKTEFKDINGNELLVNDLFRAVHDIIGHGELGNGFGAIGEENAWNAHSRMYGESARRAMTTETRGQNSWVNFSGNNSESKDKIAKGNKLISEGKKQEGEKLKKEGQDQFRFADQKIGLLPRWVSGTSGSNIQSRQSLTPLSFDQRKKRLDTARSAGALSEEQYQKALDKAMALTGTSAEQVLTPEEQAAFDKFFNKNTKMPSMAERVANIQIPDTGVNSVYSANKTFEEAGFGTKGGRPAQGNTTTIALMVQANVDFIKQMLMEGPDAIKNLMSYFGYEQNQGKLARDFNMEGLRTLNDYRLANVLFAYLYKSSSTELGISPEQSAKFTNYLKKFSSELGREIGQSLNTAKIRNVSNNVIPELIRRGVFTENQNNAATEAEDAMTEIMLGEGGEMSDEELMASENDDYEAEIEREREARQSSLLGKLINLVNKKAKTEVSEERSKGIVEKINEKIKKTQEDIKEVLNKIKCD